MREMAALGIPPEAAVMEEEEAMVNRPPARIVHVVQFPVYAWKLTPDT